jgi:hypothetical protein
MDTTDVDYSTPLRNTDCRKEEGWPPAEETSGLKLRRKQATGPAPDSMMMMVMMVILYYNPMAVVPLIIDRYSVNKEINWIKVADGLHITVVYKFKLS